MYFSPSIHLLEHFINALSKCVSSLTPPVRIIWHLMVCSKWKFKLFCYHEYVGRFCWKHWCKYCRYWVILIVDNCIKVVMKTYLTIIIGCYQLQWWILFFKIKMNQKQNKILYWSNKAEHMLPSQISKGIIKEFLIVMWST